MKKNSNNKFKLIIIFLMIFSLTGCTKYIKDENKQVIKNEITGQNLPQNILCQPEDKDILSIYEEYNKTTTNTKVDINKLPKCKNIKIISNNYDGLWTTLLKTLLKS